MKSFFPDLVSWYHLNKRNFPWRTSVFSDVETFAYHTWICEVMSQQTILSVVLPKYEKFLLQCPTVYSLAQCPEHTLRELWSGLGYYARARNLQKGAQYIVEKLNGFFPKTQEEWMLVPGCGPYTSSIIASICFCQPVPAIDGNVIRVTSRLLELTDVWSTAGQRKINDFLKINFQNFFYSYPFSINKPTSFDVAPGDVNQALMELGATVCKKNSPLCSECPIANHCLAFQHGTVHQCPPSKPRKQIKEEDIYAIFFEDKEKKLAHIIQRKIGFLKNTIGFPLFSSHFSQSFLDELFKFAQEHGATLEYINKNFSHSITNHKLKGKVVRIILNQETWNSSWSKLLPSHAEGQWVPISKLHELLSSSLDRKAFSLLC